MKDVDKKDADCWMCEKPVKKTTTASQSLISLRQQPSTKPTLQHDSAPVSLLVAVVL
jgi:hypothetical protein